MDCLDVPLEISWFSIKFCTIITFVYNCILLCISWLIEWFSTWATFLIFTSFIINLSHKQHSCECEGLAEMKRYFCKCHICNFFCLHEHSWCESSNFVLEWRNFHKNHIRISFGLQICHLSIEFSTGITFIISLSLMDNLDKIHQTC